MVNVIRFLWGKNRPYYIGGVGGERLSGFAGGLKCCRLSKHGGGNSFHSSLIVRQCGEMICKGREQWAVGSGQWTGNREQGTDNRWLGLGARLEFVGGKECGLGVWILRVRRFGAGALGCIESFEQKAVPRSSRIFAMSGRASWSPTLSAITLRKGWGTQTYGLVKGALPVRIDGKLITKSREMSRRSKTGLLRCLLSQVPKGEAPGAPGFSRPSQLPKGEGPWAP